MYLSVLDVNKFFVLLLYLFGLKVVEVGFSFIYGIVGLYCYCVGLGLVFYKVYYVFVLIGVVIVGFRFKDK